MKNEELSIQQFGDANRIAYLISGHFKGTLTPAEKKELNDWLCESEENIALFEYVMDEAESGNGNIFFESLHKEQALERLIKRGSLKPKKKFFLSFTAMAVAALLVVILGLSVLLLYNTKMSKPAQTASEKLNDREPGKNKAVLQLADGKVIILDDTAAGTIAKQGDITILQNTGGIAYRASSATAAIGYNTLSTPRGGQYKIVLSDGTRVWLNAESSLYYPTAFTDSTRQVKLIGEAYFEVAHDKTKPFIVEGSALPSDGQGWAVKVLGTQFNINAYNDENVVRTTLLEGKVEVVQKDQRQMLRPGEQAEIRVEGITTIKADTEEAIGWKEGEFIFRNARVTTVMNTLARWYDLDIEYAQPPVVHLNATIKRDATLKKVLSYLQGTGDIHFRLDGKKLTVMR
jgi:ferric-dicitrate binding protein FerR (iron transport regulator)